MYVYTVFCPKFIYVTSKLTLLKYVYKSEWNNTFIDFIVLSLVTGSHTFGYKI